MHLLVRAPVDHGVSFLFFSGASENALMASFFDVHKERLFHVGASFGYVEKALFVWHGIDSVFVTKRPVAWNVVAIVVVILCAKLCMLPYKWDRPLIRVQSIAGICVYVFVLALYLASHVVH